MVSCFRDALISIAVERWSKSNAEISECCGPKRVSIARREFRTWPKVPEKTCSHVVVFGDLSTMQNNPARANASETN